MDYRNFSSIPGLYPLDAIHIPLPKLWQLKMSPGTSLAVQRLRLGLSMQGVGVWSLVGELRSQHALQPKNQNTKQKQYCNKFDKDFKNGLHQNYLLKKMSPHLAICPPGGNLVPPLPHPHSESLCYGNIPVAQFSVFTEGLVGSISFLRSSCPLPGNIPGWENQGAIWVV